MSTEKQSFDDSAREAKVGLFADFFAFMRENKKWWLIPFLIVFSLLGALLVLTTTSLGSMMYTLF